MPVVQSQILIMASLDEVFAVAKDMEKYPDFMPDVNHVIILERGMDSDGNQTTVSEWEANVEGTPLIWTELDTFYSDGPDGPCIRYKLIEGDLEKFDGSWTFVVQEDGVLVTLEVDYDFGIPNLTELIGPTLQVKVTDNSKMMLNGMKEHIEKIPAEADEAVANESLVASFVDETENK